MNSTTATGRSTSRTLPPGVRKIICRHCGLPAWLARLAPGVTRGSSRSKVILLEPHRLDGIGSVTLNRGGRAVFTGKFPGELATHKCPAMISTCKYCAGPVRILHQPPGSAERLAVVDEDPDPAGTIVISAEGYAVDDRDRQLPGERYLWHAHDTAALMRETPGGAR